MEKFSNNEVLEHSQFMGIKSCSWQLSSSELFLRREWVTGCKTSNCAKNRAVPSIKTWLETFLIMDYSVVWPFSGETILSVPDPPTPNPLKNLLFYLKGSSRPSAKLSQNFGRLQFFSWQWLQRSMLFSFPSEKPNQSMTKQNLPKMSPSLPKTNTPHPQ